MRGRVLLLTCLATSCARPTPAATLSEPMRSSAQTEAKLPEQPTLSLATESGDIAAWAVVEARCAQAPKKSFFLRADAQGRVELDLPPGDYDLEVTAPNGYAKKRAVSVQGSMTLTLSDDCETTTGRAGGDIHSGDFVWFLSEADHAYFGAVVAPVGTFAACLPAGAYLLEAHNDELAPPFSIDSGTDLIFEAFSRASIDAPPPPVSRPPLQATIESLLAPEVRVIGIGEANHGTHEFLRIRLRESLELAKKRGVRLIAIEAGPAEVFPLDDYIHGRRRDVRVPVSKLGYWMWDTEDMLDVLDELRAYNRRAPSAAKVSLLGIDVQRSDAAARFVLASGISLTATQRAALEAAEQANALGDISPSTAADLAESLVPLTLPNDGLAPLPMRTELALEQIIWRLRMHAALPRSPWVQRDLGMAALVSTILRHAGTAPVVIWAHNSHVSTDASSESRPLGAHLRERLGRAYVSVGLLMERGTFRAWDFETKVGVIEHAVNTSPRSSLEAALAPHVAKGDAFVRLADLDELTDWFRVPHRAMENGGVMMWNNQWPLVRHVAAFDIVGFVADVTPTTPTPTGVRRATAPPP